MVLQHEGPGIRPVVGNVVSIVVAQHVGWLVLGRAGGIVRILARLDTSQLLLADEAIHFALVDITRGIRCMVRAAVVEVVTVVERPDAVPGFGVGHADRGHPVLHGDAVGAGIGAKVTVERAILLHNKDDVLDLVNAVDVAWATASWPDNAW